MMAKTTSRPEILIVEDNRELREALCATLELAGYRVHAVNHGPGALDVLHGHCVGLVVSDVQMQPMDGLALLADIKAMWPRIPVVLMTAVGAVEEAVQAIRAGACDYVQKPFGPDRLLELVSRHALAGEAAQPGQIAVAGSQIDMKSLERAHILETLAQVNGCRRRAVERLGISERTLRHKLRQYRLAQAAGSDS